MHQLGWARALAAVPAHVFHLAVAARREPFVEASLVGCEIDARDANLGEAERTAKLFHFDRECGESLFLVGLHVLGQSLRVSPV